MRKGFLISSFSLEDTPENRALVQAMKDLAAKDGWSMSHLIREAALEYYKNHTPGNPQLALAHWTANTPMPRTLRHKHQWSQESGGGAHWYECACGERRS